MAPRLLLHCCCAPCATWPIEHLKEKYDITLFFYNPCIYPREEYTKRKDELLKLADIHKLPIKIIDENEQIFLNSIKGRENDKEGGDRCELCFRQRLEKTGDLAEAEIFDYFGTTLTISPHKNSHMILEAGRRVESQLSVRFLHKDFKLTDGFNKSIELSKKYGLYRQNYCGCRFSKKI